MGEPLKTNNPKVSVIVIVYNAKLFVAETLDSILSQDYANIEVVVADDCSTDGTQEILKNYQAKYPNKIKLILNEKNLGITPNSNVAFFACSGELLALTGGDDLFLPGKISAQVQVFINNANATLCYHPTEIFDSDSGKTMYVTNLKKSSDTSDLFSIVRKAGIPGASSVMFRRDACPSYGFDERIPNASDWKLQIDLAAKGEVVKVNKVLGRYRKHGAGVSNRTYDLLEESLQVLTLSLQEHPEIIGFKEVCDQGKARYIAGEAYRQLSKNPDLSKELMARALLLSPQDFRYKLFYGVTKLGWLLPFVSFMLSKMKYVLKDKFL